MNRHCVLILAVLLGLTTEVRSQEPDPLTSGRILHSMVWTGAEALVWGGGSEGHFFGHGFRLDPGAKDRAAMSSKGAPSGRWGHAAVWTGTEMVVWGGRSRFESEAHHEDGARYDPATDTWRPMATANAPTPRSQMAAVWTGEEMLVWSGYGNGGIAWNTGGRYRPRTDTWRPISEVGAPEPRVEALNVWTGKEWIVWGGITPDLKRTLRSGARYNPTTDTWTALPFHEAPQGLWGSRAVWTGKEMIVWGGSVCDGDSGLNVVVQTGAAYDPNKNTWRPLSTVGTPTARFFHSAVWNGSQLIVWGGGDQNPPRNYDDGGIYDPVKDTWQPLPWGMQPAARGMHTAVWTGRGMLLFGGATGGSSAFSDAVLWEPGPRK